MSLADVFPWINIIIVVAWLLYIVYNDTDWSLSVKGRRHGLSKYVSK